MGRTEPKTRVCSRWHTPILNIRDLEIASFSSCLRVRGCYKGVDLDQLTSMAQQQPPPLILFLAGAAAGALIAANGVLSAVRKRAGRSRSRDDGRRVRVGLEVAKDVERIVVGLQGLGLSEIAYQNALNYSGKKAKNGKKKFRL